MVGPAGKTHTARTVRAGGPARKRADNGDRRAGTKPRAEEVARKQRAALRRGRPPAHGFAELGLPRRLVGLLAEQGISNPFPIQGAAIPDALSGRDLLGRARTGSGKTLAFGLPVLARLSSSKRRGRAPRALILSPTRELAVQTNEAINWLARGMGLRTVLVAGGMSYGPQLKALSRGVDVVVATPGRLIDLMERGAVDLGAVEVSVLDEADQMCDLGFLPDVTGIWDRVPPAAQHMLFSATLDEQVSGLADTYLRDPITHGVDAVAATVTGMTHEIWLVHPHDRGEVVAALAQTSERTLVFVRTQLAADRLAAGLRAGGVLAGSLHGGLRQGARSRVLGAFRGGELPVLVATDVAARGIHVNEVGLVVQADMAGDAKDYLHRAGRTARAGRSGRVVSLVAPRQRRRMERIADQPAGGERAAVPGGVVAPASDDQRTLGRGETAA